MSMPQCIVCGSHQWLRLPDPSSSRSVTTSGCFVDETLGKSQCATCGIVQRTEHRYLGLTDFYENRYNTYYQRPGTQVFNAARYAEIAQWVSACIGGFIPDSVFEVGCGRGWTLAEIRKIYPQASVGGIEPSVDNSEEARKQGFQVLTGKLGPDNVPAGRYDLIFSNHVLQHTTDPRGFLQVMGELVSDRGLIVLTVQDSSTPSNELLYSDQNFSFMPQHLVGLAEAVGLDVLSWRRAPDTDGLRLSQLMVCGRKNTGHASLQRDQVPELDEGFLPRLYGRRTEYLEAWPRIEDFLCWKTRKNQLVYNFGAGMYSYLLACYCDRYWDRVTACTLDRFSGEFAEKQVVPFEELRLSDGDCAVLGTRPAIQKLISSRIESGGSEAVCWDNFVAA